MTVLASALLLAYSSFVVVHDHDFAPSPAALSLRDQFRDARATGAGEPVPPKPKTNKEASSSPDAQGAKLPPYTRSTPAGGLFIKHGFSTFVFRCFRLEHGLSNLTPPGRRAVGAPDSGPP